MLHVSDGSEQVESQAKGTFVQGLALVSTAWLAVTATSLIAPVLPRMAEAFKDVPHSADTIQILVALPALVVALFSGVCGLLVDRLGRKSFLLVGLLLYAAAGLAPTWLTDLHLIIASRVLVGVAESIIMTSGTTLLSDFFPGPSRARWFAVQTGSATLMSVVFVALGGMLGEFGWRAPFYFYALPLVLFPLILLLIKEPARTVVTTAKSPVTWSSLIVPILATLFGAICFYVVVIQISFILTRNGVTSTSQIGLGSAIAAAAVAVGSVLFRLLGAASTAVKLAISFALSAAGFYYLSQAHDFQGIVIGAAINSLGGGLALPTLLTWAATRLGKAHTGKAVGAWNTAFFLGQFLSPISVIVITTKSGGTSNMLLGFAIACAVALLMAVVGAVVSAQKSGSAATLPES